MRPVLQIRLVKRPTSLISSDQLCQLGNFIRPVCHAMRLGLSIVRTKELKKIVATGKIVKANWIQNKIILFVATSKSLIKNI